MKVTLLPAFEDNYIFLLEHLGEAMVVDPGDAQPVIDFLKQNHLNLKAVLQTHHHWDHVGGTQKLHQRYACDVYTPHFEGDRYKVSSHMLKEGDHILFHDQSINVLETPGHTYDHISYHVPCMNVLFSGDTLFNMGCGRVFDGSMESLYESLQKIKELPSETQVYCAHEYTLHNIAFAKSAQPSDALSTYQKKCANLREKNQPTVPFSLKENIVLNPFLKAPTLDAFTDLRQKKDSFS